MTFRLPAPLQKLHDWACRYEGVLLLITLILLLRLPNFSEPYWYGDEAIYLTIGTAMRHGSVLYQEIIDHKTPLIYYFAMVPGQIWFRMLNFVWMSAATTFFYWLSKKLFPVWLAFASSVAFVLFTTLPWLEGHIPNGELFVMGFILAALWILSKTKAFALLISSDAREKKNHRKTWLWTVDERKKIFVAGVLSGLALLTKVPALLDAGALGSIFFFIVVAYITPKTWKTVTLWFIQAGSIFVGGVFLPLVLSMVYFWLRGAIADYLQFGLLYNLHYSGNWTLPFTQEWLVAAFSLPGKALVLGVVLLISIAWARWKPQQSEAAWIYFWTFAALFAATLSNRPYPHYLLQTILPAAFALGILLRKHSHWIARVMMVDAIGAIIVVLILLDFGLYNTGEYYWRYIKMGSGQISPQEYRHEFDWLVSQNEEIVPIIVENTQPSDRIFLWGTNAMLYAQAQRAPATRFTVAFHVHDLDVYEQTMEEVRTAEPKFIVVMKSESELPGLSEYLHQYYLVSAETNDMILYRRTTLSSLDLLQ